MIIPRKPTRSLGFAFVTFTSTKDGENARQKMHNKKVWGRILKCAKAKVPKAVDLARKQTFVEREKARLLKSAADRAKDEVKSAGKKKHGKRQKSSGGVKLVDKSSKAAGRKNVKKISKAKASKKQPTISPSKKLTSAKRKSNKVPQRTSKRRKK